MRVEKTQREKKWEIFWSRYQKLRAEAPEDFSDYRVVQSVAKSFRPAMPPSTAWSMFKRLRLYGTADSRNA